MNNNYYNKYLKYKDKYIKLKGGQIIMNKLKDVISGIDKKRFKAESVFLKGIDYLQIIDLQYNNRYLINRLYDFYCLYDSDLNIVYIFNNLGNEIESPLEINKVIEIIKSNTRNSVEFKKNINLLEISKKVGCYNIDLSNIFKEIDKLNIILRKKCGNLDLRFENNYNLILCLYYNETCISSIILIYKDEDTIGIDSNTYNNYQGNKYNTLLRAIVVILSSYIICNSKNISKISSNAINPISAWLLISNFDVTYSCGIVTIDENIKQNIKQKSKEELKDYIFSLYKLKGMDGLLIELELSPINLEKARDLFIKLTNGETNNIICPEFMDL